MTYLLGVLAVLLLVATVLPWSLRREWWVRVLDFPRLQLAVACALWLLLWWYLDSAATPWLSLLALGVLGALVHQCYWIFPNTAMHRQEVKRHDPGFDGHCPTISMITSNVLMHNRNAEPLLSQVKQYRPDILITLESDDWWQQQLDTLSDYPHRIACPLDNLYGMHVYSTLPLHDTAIHHLVEQDKPSMQATVEIRADVMAELHVVHPAPPAPGENLKSTERDVELLLLADRLSGSNKRIIVAGDLNDVAWSATTRLFRQISGLLDLRIGRGLFNTFHADHWFARWPLDHVFVSRHFKLVNIRRLPPVGSDHFPLLVELAVTDTARQYSAVTDDPVDTERLDSIMKSETARGLSS